MTTKKFRLEPGDELIDCPCGTSWVWTRGEQEFYKRQNLPHRPKYCAACKVARKQNRRHAAATVRAGI